nr:MAG TPA: hypothetical protein [Caudoviricetes sp.]
MSTHYIALRINIKPSTAVAVDGFILSPLKRHSSLSKRLL